MSIPFLPALGSLFNVAAGHAAAVPRAAGTPTTPLPTATALVPQTPTLHLPTATALVPQTPTPPLPTATTLLAQTPTPPLPTATTLVAGSPSPGATGAVASVTPSPGATGAVASTTPAAGATATAPPAVAPTSAPPAAPPTPSPFSADYFTQAAQPGLGLLSTGFLLLSAIMLGAGAYFYFVGRNQWRRTNRPNYNAASFWSLVGMILGGVGLLFSIFRILALDGLNQRAWLYGVLIVWIGFAVYAAYYFLRVHPAKQAEFQRTHKPPRGGAARPQAGRPPAARVADPNAPPARPAGAPGNPRGTSTRGERRRAKKR